MAQPLTALAYATTPQFGPAKRMSDNELVTSLKNGSQPSFTFLFNTYGDALYGVILDFVEDKALAKDVLQEVFVGIYKKINTYDESKSRLFTWMVNITRQLCIDTLKRSNCNNFVSTNQILDGDGAVVKSLHPEVGNVCIHKLLHKIKPSHRKLIELSYYKGYTNQEIAQMMEMPIGTVQTRIKSALVQLKTYM